MKILKVKLLNDRMSVKYEKTVSGGETANYTLDLPERPAPDFFEALDKLLPFWMKSLELTKAGKLEVYGGSFSYHSDTGCLSVVLHGKRSLQKSEFNHAINAPKFSEPTDQEEESEHVMTDEFLEAANALIETTKSYVDGKREQMKAKL